MKKLSRYFFIIYTIMLFVTGFGIWFVLDIFFPERMVDSYFIIPLFFYLLGLVFIYRLNRTPVNEPKKMINLYMLMRMIKILISVTIIFIYWLFDQSNMRNFAIIFVVFYLIHLILETFIYMKIELYYKYKSEQLKSTR